MRSLKRTLTLGIILLAIFGISFFIFYKRAQQSLAKQPPLILTPAVLNQPLPAANLVNISGEQLSDDKLRRGKVVLVFSLIECVPCDEENDFLKSAVGDRKDVSFYYVIPFGKKELALKEAQKKYAFETVFDDHSMLSRSLQVYQVPIKVFLQDGIIKRTWFDATTEPDKQAEFKEWLKTL